MAAPIHHEAPPAVAAAASGPPALFAKLFGPDTSWRYPFVMVWTQTGARTVGVMECWLSGAGTEPGGWSSTISCAGDDFGIIADGWEGALEATSRGLWWNGRSDKTTPLDDADALFAASPQPSTRAGRSVRAFAGGWCSTESRPPPAVYIQTFCIRDGAFIGGAYTSSEFTLHWGEAP